MPPALSIRDGVNKLMTHHPSILLTLDDLEKINNVLVEIEDLSAQLEICIAQKVELLVFLNILGGGKAKT